jgi:predicted SnoaL-like aldol condensation-catalyzing enzyme
MTDNVQRNKAIVCEFLTKTFTDRDFTALERWLSPDYIQHNPFIPANRAGLRALVEKYPEGRHYEPGMIIIAEGDLVMAQHWDVLQEEVPAEKTVAGNAMFTRP